MSDSTFSLRALTKMVFIYFLSTYSFDVVIPVLGAEFCPQEADRRVLEFLDVAEFRMEKLYVFQAPRPWAPTYPLNIMKLPKTTNGEHSVKLGIDNSLLFIIAYLSSNTHCNTRGEVQGVLHLPKQPELLPKYRKLAFD